MTNIEKIRAMSVEELTDFLLDLYDTCSYCPARIVCRKIKKKGHCCDYVIKYWLESEVEE